MVTNCAKKVKCNFCSKSTELSDDPVPLCQNCGRVPTVPITNSLVLNSSPEIDEVLNDSSGPLTPEQELNAQLHAEWSTPIGRASDLVPLINSQYGRGTAELAHVGIVNNVALKKVNPQPDEALLFLSALHNPGGLEAGAAAVMNSQRKLTAAELEKARSSGLDIPTINDFLPEQEPTANDNAEAKKVTTPVDDDLARLWG